MPTKYVFALLSATKANTMWPTACVRHKLIRSCVHRHESTTHMCVPRGHPRLVPSETYKFVTSKGIKATLPQPKSGRIRLHTHLKQELALSRCATRSRTTGHAATSDALASSSAVVARAVISATRARETLILATADTQTARITTTIIIITTTTAIAIEATAGPATSTITFMMGTATGSGGAGGIGGIASRPELKGGNKGLGFQGCRIG
ncbi:hypothetical protein V8F06_011711 [Rhypophila decipiens]